MVLKQLGRSLYQPKQSSFQFEWMYFPKMCTEKKHWVPEGFGNKFGVSQNPFKYTRENNQSVYRVFFWGYIHPSKTYTTCDGCHRPGPSVSTQIQSLYPYLPYLATSPNLLTEHIDIYPKFHNKQHVELSVKRAMLV